MMVACIAMSLYQYNVDRYTRAARIYAHFNGDCAEVSDLIQLVDNKNWATEMAFPTAKAYLQHAMDTYGSQAAHRVVINGG